MSLISGLTNFALPTSYRLGDGIGSGKNDIFGTLIKNLKDQAAKTPLEKARDSVLGKHRLSEPQYTQMPASARASLDKEIAEAVKTAAEELSRGKSRSAPGVRMA